MEVLFATSEAEPLVRTGGLAEVSLGLPKALRARGHDVRLVLPGYSQALTAAEELSEVAQLEIKGARERVRILAGRVPDSTLPVYLVDAPSLFEREGGPYANADGDEWADNAERFVVFSRAIAAMGLGIEDLGWQPEIVHCNDWQTGLAPALLALEPIRPASLFTVHNMAAQGLFSWDVFHRLAIPRPLWSRHGLEHYGNFSFLKGGLAFSDRINTVSPTYAREIQTEALGCGLEEVLQLHAERLAGVLNGVDYDTWNPASDPHLSSNYDVEHLDDRPANKLMLQRHLGLPESVDTPLIGYAGRLLERRGSDILLEIVPELERLDAQLVVLGQGDRELEHAWGRAASRWTRRLAVVIGNDEPLLHQLEAAADLFVIPSRIEPCGLDQLHSMRYGAIPIARHTGGLADSVIDAGNINPPPAEATGFCFDSPEPGVLLATLRRALARYREQGTYWETLLRNGMQRDFGWPRSAASYESLYGEALEHRDRGHDGPL